MLHLGDDLYAVAVLYEGVYVPLTLVGTDGVQLASQLVEMTASTTLKEPTRFIEAARALELFRLTPEEHMAAKIQEMPQFSEINVFWQLLTAEFAERLGVFATAEQKILDQFSRRLAFTRYSVRDWPEYMSSVALVTRSYPDSKHVPDILAESVGKSFLSKFKYKSTSLQDKLSIIDATLEILQFEKWHKATEQQQPISILEKIIPAAQAHDVEWTPDIEAEIQKQLCALVDETTDPDSLIMLASMALNDYFEAPACYEKAMGKIKDQIAAGIAATPAPGPNEPACEVLIKKNLSNYGMNSCVVGNQAKLLDLAQQAMRIEEDGLAQSALQKAGVLN